MYQYFRYKTVEKWNRRFYGRQKSWRFNTFNFFEVAETLKYADYELLLSLDGVSPIVISNRDSLSQFYFGDRQALGY